MARLRDVSVVAVHLGSRFALLEDDTICRIATMLDDDGDETEEPGEAVAAVAKLPDGTWVAFGLDGFTEWAPSA